MEWLLENRDSLATQCYIDHHAKFLFDLFNKKLNSF